MQPPANQLPLSVILSDLVEHGEPKISVKELTQRLGGRASGALLFLFGLACLLPLPPGATTIFGLPLLVLAPQLVIGASAPWLPERVKRRTISTTDLKAILPRLIPWLKKLEAVSRPRLAVLFNPVGERVMGVVCTVLALVLILPIPLGNVLPALAVSALSFSLIQRDGVVALVGYLIALASGTVLGLVAHIIVKAFEHLSAVL